MTMTKETLFMQCFNLLNAWRVKLGDGMRGNFHATSQTCEDWQTVYGCLLCCMYDKKN